MNFSNTHHYPLPLIIFALICFSCSNKQEQQSHTPGNAERIAIDGSRVNEEIDITDWIEAIHLFPLEDVAGSIIGEVENIFLTADHIIVFDRFTSKKVVVFDRQGNFVGELEILGDGPDKLRQIHDCWLNNQGNIEVYDIGLQKILVYNEDFEVEKVINAKDPVRFHHLINIPGSSAYLGYSGYSGQDGHSFKLAFLDSLLSVKNTKLPFNEYLTGALISIPLDPLVRIGDTVRFYQNYDPNIYTVKSDGDLQIRFQLDYIHKPLPRNFEQELILENPMPSQESRYEDRIAIFKGYTGFSGSWWETKDYAIFTSFDTGYKSFVSIYDKGAKKIIAQGRYFAENDRYKMFLPSHFYTTASESNRFVTLMPGYILKENYITPESAYFKTINEEAEILYVVEVLLK